MNKKQKKQLRIMLLVFITLLILSGIGIGIYFAVKPVHSSKNGTVVASNPKLVRFSQDADPPESHAWTMGTSYKYSYVDKNDPTRVGVQSSTSAVIKDDLQTFPIMKVSVNPDYNIKVYRGTDGPRGEYTELDVKVDSDGTFTDYNNPAPVPPPSPVDPCDKMDCGFNAECDDGKCICLNGYTGYKCSLPPIPQPVLVPSLVKWANQY